MQEPLDTKSFSSHPSYFLRGFEGFGLANLNSTDDPIITHGNHFYTLLKGAGLSLCESKL